MQASASSTETFPWKYLNKHPKIMMAQSLSETSSIPFSELSKYSTDKSMIQNDKFNILTIQRKNNNNKVISNNFLTISISSIEPSISKEIDIVVLDCLILMDQPIDQEKLKDFRIVQELQEVITKVVVYLQLNHLSINNLHL